MADGGMFNGGGVLFTIDADGKPIFKTLEKVDAELLKIPQKTKTFGQQITAALAGAGRAFEGLQRNYMNIRFAVTDAITGMKSFTDKALATRAALMGLQVIAGENFGKVRESVKRLAEDGQVSLTALSTAMKNLLARGFSPEQAEQMLKTTKAMAMFNRQAGLTMDEAVQRFTEGLKNEMSTLTDSAGATKNLSNVWADYARSIGVGVNSLTTAQKRQAEYNWTIDEGTNFQGKYNEALNGAEGQIGKANAQFLVLQSTLGEKLLPIQVGLLKTTSGILDFFLRLPGPVQLISVLLPAVAVGLGMIIPGITALVPMIGALIAGTATLGTTVALATGGLSLLAAVVVPLGLGLYNAGKKADEANKKIDDFNQKLKDTKSAEEYRAALEEIRKEYGKLDEAARKSIDQQNKIRRTQLELLSSSILNNYSPSLIEAYRTRLANNLDLKTGKSIAPTSVTGNGATLADAIVLGGNLSNLNAQTVAGVKKGDPNAAFKNIILTEKDIENIRKGLEAQEDANKLLNLSNDLTDQNKAANDGNTGSKGNNKNATKELSSALVKLNQDYEELSKEMERVRKISLTGLGQELADQLLEKFDGLSGSIIDVMQSYQDWGKATRDLETNQKALASAVEKLEAAKKRFEEADKAEKLTPEIEGAFEDAKKNVENYTKAVEKSKDAVNDSTTAMAAGWISVAQGVADMAYAFIQAYDEVIQNGGDAAEATEAAFEKSFQAIAQEVPIVGKLIALFIDKIWETETERREKALNQINAAIARFEHQIRLGNHQFMQQQIDFYEQQLAQMLAAGAKEEDIWAVEEKLYDLKLKQVDAQKELNDEIEAQKQLLEDMKKSEAEKQLDQKAREFERLVTEGKIDLGVSEDRQTAIDFYSKLAAKAGELGATNVQQNYLDKISELKGGLKETRTYGGVSFSAATASEVAKLNSAVGSITAGSITDAVEDTPEGKEASDAIALKEKLERYDASAKVIRDQMLEGFLNSQAALVKQMEKIDSLYSIYVSKKEAGAKSFAYKKYEDEQAKLPAMIDDFKMDYLQGNWDKIAPSLRTSFDVAAIRWDMTDGGVAIQKMRDELINLGLDKSKITFHDGGIVGGSASFADLFGGALRPDEMIAKLQIGEMVVPRRETAAIMEGGGKGNLTINVGQMVFQGANDPERNGMETLRALEKIAKRNGLTILGGR